MKKIILFIFFLAFLIRLIALDQSLWLDEATTARVVQQYSFTQIITRFSPHDFHPPLYYLFMKVWTTAFGYTEVSLRMPSVIFSLLTGYIIYFTGKKIDSGRASLARMTKDRVGLWAAAFFLFNPLIVYYSQEARMYMMATFFLTAALHFLYENISHSGATKRSDRIYLKDPIGRFKNHHFLQDDLNKSRNKFGMKEIILFNISISVSFLIFYGSIFLIIPMLLFMLHKKHYRAFFASFVIFNLALLAISPLLYKQLNNAKEQLHIVANWTQVLGKANLKNLLLIPLKFSIGRISFYPKWFYWLVSGIWTVFIWYLIIKNGIKNKILILLVIGSLGLGILFSFFTPLLQYFRFLYLIPIISLLLASDIDISIYRYIIMLGFLIFSLIYLINPNYRREDWKSLTQSLPRSSQVYMIPSSSDPISYYRKDVKIKDLNLLNKSTLAKEIIIIPYTSDIYGLNYEAILKAKKFSIDRKQVFRGLSLEVWKKN